MVEPLDAVDLLSREAFKFMLARPAGQGTVALTQKSEEQGDRVLGHLDNVLDAGAEAVVAAQESAS